MNRHLLRLERKMRRKGDTAQLAAQLAPLEEQDKRLAIVDDEFGGAVRHTVAHQETGAIVVERDSLSVSRDLRQQSKGIAGLEPVVIVILCLALAFIGLIAWLISRMP